MIRAGFTPPGQVEVRDAPAAQFFAQRGQLAVTNGIRGEQPSAVPLGQGQRIARARPQGVKGGPGKGDLALGREFYAESGGHESTINHLTFDVKA